MSQESLVAMVARWRQQALGGPAHAGGLEDVVSGEHADELEATIAESNTPGNRPVKQPVPFTPITFDRIQQFIIDTCYESKRVNKATKTDPGDDVGFCRECGVEQGVEHLSASCPVAWLELALEMVEERSRGWS